MVAETLLVGFETILGGCKMFAVGHLEFFLNGGTQLGCPLFSSLWLEGSSQDGGPPPGKSQWERRRREGVHLLLWLPYSLGVTWGSLHAAPGKHQEHLSLGRLGSGGLVWTTPIGPRA